MSTQDADPGGRAGSGPDTVLSRMVRRARQPLTVLEPLTPGRWAAADGHQPDDAGSGDPGFPAGSATREALPREQPDPAGPRLGDPFRAWAGPDVAGSGDRQPGLDLDAGPGTEFAFSGPSPGSGHSAAGSEAVPAGPGRPDALPGGPERPAAASGRLRYPAARNAAADPNELQPLLFRTASAAPGGRADPGAGRPEPAVAARDVAAAGPAVTVTIGRLDVHVAPEAPRRPADAARPRPSFTPRVTLADFLAGRDGNGPR